MNGDNSNSNNGNNEQQRNHQQEQPDKDHDEMPPFEQFMEDWAAAKEHKDPNAPFCILATVDGEGFPRTRIVGIREVNLEKESIMLFINDTSPKFRELQATNKFEVLIFWQKPRMIQYRLRGIKWTRLEQSKMEELWKKKPKQSQLLDYYYTHHRPQSSSLAGKSDSGRTEFVETMQSLQKEFLEGDKEIPFQSIATGLILEPNEIEEWRGSSDRLHERYLYKKMITIGGRDSTTVSWKKETLVP